MKRVCALLMACCLGLLLLLPAASLAAEDLTGRPIADGTVAAVRYADVTAPFSGTLAPFTLENGDAVKAGDPLMQFVTAGVYAPETGVLTALFAAEGDSADTVCARYGAVFGVEPAHRFVLNATTQNAYDEDENRLIRLGETLYFEAGNMDGVGRVIHVDGKSYQVEVTQGTFDLGKSLRLYRDSDLTSKKCVGTGVVARRSDALAQASGRVIALHAAEGDAVASGQLVLEVVSADADPDVRSASVASPESGVVTLLAVQPGQQVWKGQLLCRVSLTDALEVVADVDEAALNGLKVGDTLPVTLDMDRNTVLTGTVTEISALGVTRQNAAYFAVHVSLPAGVGLLGASASVYLPADGE